MTACHRALLEARCRERGYTLDEVMPCVVAQDGDEWTIDVDHPAYPRHSKPGFVPPQPEPVPPSHGPGTELKALLAGWPFRIVSAPDCKCNARARYMDENGCDWCESPEGMAEIMGFLREAAEERGLPFLDLPARLLVKRAIANARKAEARRVREAEAAAEARPAV
ncbi:MAG: hypothetical protein EBS54_01440 [Betaproteobacteria bacterium]|nr:hypothetical protein [Betaproteobacteria bacterium]